MKKFDDNNDGVTQLSEFDAMMTSLEPKVSKEVIINLFKKATEFSVEDSASGNIDAINPEVLVQLIL